MPCDKQLHHIYIWFRLSACHSFDDCYSLSVFSIIASQIIGISSKASHRRITGSNQGNQSHLIAHLSSAVYAKACSCMHACIHYVSWREINDQRVSQLNFDQYWFWARWGGRGASWQGEVGAKLCQNNCWKIVIMYLFYYDEISLNYQATMSSPQSSHSQLDPSPTSGEHSLIAPFSSLSIESHKDKEVVQSRAVTIPSRERELLLHDEVYFSAAQVVRKR